MLRADLFALAATDAIGRLPAVFRIVPVVHVAVPIAVQLFLVHAGKQIGNGDLAGTAVRAIPAGRARNEIAP